MCSFLAHHFERALAVWLLAFGLAPFLAAQTYSPPANARQDINLDANWRFIQQDVSGAQAANFDDSSWTNVNLPHTWDIPDGQDGPGTTYYRGIGWYRTHYTVDGSYTNREFFLKFDGAFLVADVYVNGNFLGEHQGGFAAFVFDATPSINVGADNVIAVKVNNAANTNIPPLDADFTFWGGIYRDVHLLMTDPAQVSPLDYGSPGVYLKPTSVSSSSANLQITTVVSNASAVAMTLTVRAIVTDAATNIVTTLTNVVTLPAASVSNVVASTIIANPHLWNGLSDPYLYQTFIELYRSTNLVDWVSQPLGFRWFSVDPTNGFSLNGQPYDLHGVAMHQDWLNCGWALTNAQRDTNFIFIKELGATAVRLCHYEHDDYTYQLADQNGVILWSEIPLIDRITESPAFYTNTGQQLRELIRQRYNHPSVICWGVFNEITLESGPVPTNLVNQLVQLEAQEDPTRPSTAATLAGNGDATSWMPQHIAFNEYYGWYESPLNGIAAWADNMHASHPTNCIGITEYGAGASIHQHSEDPVVWPTTTGGLFHPEEWQNLVHETNWALMKARPFLWIKTAWNGFDFASDGRDEGDTPGRNDKGLVTYDRQIRKDAFYFYKANWTTNPMVYITGHTFTNRLTNAITAKVYANCDSVELFLNGTSQGPHTSTNFIFTWPITLAGGSNLVQAVGTKGGIQVTDSLVWTPSSVSVLAATLTDLIATAPTPGANDLAQLSTVGNQTFPDGLNYYTDNQTGHNAGEPGQTFTTGTNSGAYTLTSVSLKTAGLGSYSGIGTLQPYYLHIYSVSGATATLLQTYSSANFTFSDGDWLQWSGLSVALATNATYAWSFGKASSTSGWEALGVASGNPYAGGEIGLFPPIGGAITFGSSHGFDAVFDVGLAAVNLTRTNIVTQLSGNQLTLSWPADHIGWRLQIQTNSLNTGLGTNWVDLPGSSTTNQVIITISPANGTVFYRMAY